ncbi:MAG TPA: glycogen debranching enzyme, partial [Frankiaceae bacterium]|nr:glycogen debranching enzyme [Frankiaceae bacterium]
LWTEWNGKYRDTVRDFWRGEGSTIGEFASRLTGSSDLYEGNGRKPFASINFVTAHDGFTLHDLVSYNDKHNEANGEESRDGESTNRSWNCGVEGPTDDLDIVALREQQKRNLLTTLLLSQGVPMIVAGDEMGRTQGGNNNAYCQDNPISWLDWADVQENSILLDFTRRVAALRTNHPIFHRRRFFQGHPLRGAGGLDDIVWLNPSSEVMSQEDWDNGWARSLGIFLNGSAIPSPDRRGNPVRDDSFLLYFNAHFEPVEFTIPDGEYGEAWAIAVSTAEPLADHLDESGFKARDSVEVEARSILVLRRQY